MSERRNLLVASGVTLAMGHAWLVVCQRAAAKTLPSAFSAFIQGVQMPRLHMNP